MLFLWLGFENSHVLEAGNVVCTHYFVGFLCVDPQLDISVENKGGLVIYEVVLVSFLFTVFFLNLTPIPNKAEHPFLIPNDRKLLEINIVRLAKALQHQLFLFLFHDLMLLKFRVFLIMPVILKLSFLLLFAGSLHLMLDFFQGLISLYNFIDFLSIVLNLN